MTIGGTVVVRGPLERDLRNVRSLAAAAADAVRLVPTEPTEQERRLTELRIRDAGDYLLMKIADAAVEREMREFERKMKEAHD